MFLSRVPPFWVSSPPWGIQLSPPSLCIQVHVLPLSSVWLLCTFLFLPRGSWHFSSVLLSAGPHLSPKPPCCRCFRRSVVTPGAAAGKVPGQRSSVVVVPGLLSSSRLHAAREEFVSPGQPIGSGPGAAPHEFRPRRPGRTPARAMDTVRHPAGATLLSPRPPGASLRAASLFSTACSRFLSLRGQKGAGKEGGSFRNASQKCDLLGSR